MRGLRKGRNEEEEVGKYREGGTEGREEEEKEENEG